MPVIFALITPILALYLRFKIMHYAVKLILFFAIYESFKSSTQWAINIIFEKLQLLEFPCIISYLLNTLGIFDMINFSLSFWFTIYLSRFFYNSVMKII